MIGVVWSGSIIHPHSIKLTTECNVVFGCLQVTWKLQSGQMPALDRILQGNPRTTTPIDFFLMSYPHKGISCTMTLKKYIQMERNVIETE